MEQPLAPGDILMHAFPGIEEKEAREIIACGKMISVAPQTVICHEDEHEQSFYIILEGELVATKQISVSDERILSHLNRGEFFGEMAILGDAPRAATVKSVTDAALLEIHKDAFTGVLQSNNSVMLAIVRSVSQRLRSNDQMAAEDLRIRAKELADAYQQLAEEDYARSQFLSTIAHELRAPLTAASGFLQVIRLGMLQGDGLNSAIDTISRNVQEIITLTNDILFMQEMEMILPQFQSIHIAPVLTSSVDHLRAQAEQNQVDFRLAIAPTLPPILGHAKSLQRAFTAVIENAIKFSPDGGEVSISVSYEENMVVITIEDHGIGIPEEVLPRIFQRFFHTDAVGKHLFGGIGIGLSIARQVIKQHQGRIQVTSEEGKGSIFTIYLNAVSP